MSYTTLTYASSYEVAWIPPTDQFYQGPLDLGTKLDYRSAYRKVLAYCEHHGVTISKRTTSKDQIDRWFDLEQDGQEGTLAIYVTEHHAETATERGTY